MQSGRAEEVALMKAVLAGDVASMQALLQQKQGLIYAHSKDGENIWHAAAQGGHSDVSCACVGMVDLATTDAVGRLSGQLGAGMSKSVVLGLQAAAISWQQT